MVIDRSELEKIVCETEETLKKYTSELERCDGSHLACSINMGKRRFYKISNEGGKIIRKTIGIDSDDTKALARKEYLTKAIPVLKENIKLLSNAIEGIENIDIEKMQNTMIQAYRYLPQEYFLRDDSGIFDNVAAGEPDGIKRHFEWGKEAYEKSTYHPEQLKFLTSGGFRVRSKSEQHIAEQLLMYGVPFRYEQVIQIDEFTFSADFTFRDKDMNLFYWEHAGMMDLPSYVESHARKMHYYEAVGIVPWKNLIVTYDIDGGINIPMVKSIIENDILPRL